MLRGLFFGGNKNKKRLGSRVNCLVDSVDSEKTCFGRFYGQGPVVDSICTIRNCRAQAGQFVQARVVGAKDYDLIVEQI